MRYVIAGYVIVLSILFLYAVGLVWRRRKFARLVAAAAADAHEVSGDGVLAGEA